MLYADTSAALAIEKQEGAGKLRHIHIYDLHRTHKHVRVRSSRTKPWGAEFRESVTKYLAREDDDGSPATKSTAPREEELNLA